MTSSSQSASRVRASSERSNSAAEANEHSDRRLFLSNAEAARFLNLSPRTLEKHRVIGGGPRFRKFGRRIVYAIVDLEVWADARTCESTSDPQYIAKR